MALNKVMLIGNAGKNPEVRHLESGVVKANFTLATSERYRDRNTGETKEQTEWHNIVCWRTLAEVAEKYVKKGTQLYVEGKITSRQYTDQTGASRTITEIVADNFQLLGRRTDNDEAPQPAPNAYQPQPRSAYSTGNQAYNQPQQPVPAPAPVPAAAPAPNLQEEDDLPF
ncbi:MAG: single-stranded DNA-binding protein [Alistipes sp.]|nr:single-stranded DNA-binding protein [Candidatus Minthomonas equi]